MKTSAEILSEALTELYQNVSSIRMYGRGLTEIPSNSFLNFSDLRKLDLASNRISYVEDGAFYGLSSLEELDIHSNRLHKIDRNISANSIIDRNLSNNRIEIIEYETFV